QCVARPRSRAALVLRPPEELGEFLVAFTVGVLDVGLETKRVAEAGFGGPDDVVVLVLGTGDLSGLGVSHGASLSRTGPVPGTPDPIRQWPTCREEAST